MKTALLSVSDTTGLVAFAQGLQQHQYQIIATGSTKMYLENAGLKHLKSVEDITGFPEIFDGRVKTLHPKIHGGILGRRQLATHQQQAQQHQIEWIDLVCVNLYPFKETIAQDNVTFEAAIEKIDIGGPTLLRSAAKNHESVTVVVDVEDYDLILKELAENKETTLATRRYLATKVFLHTAAYDSLISNYLNQQLTTPIEDTFTITGTLKQTLRYGENPFQKGWFYQTDDVKAYSLVHAQQLHGKALSYNNIQDGDAALSLLQEFAGQTACVALKHANPCGVALADTVEHAFLKAYQADPISIFGGIVAFNQPVDAAVANHLSQIFLEIIMAPAFSEEALAILRKKKNIRLLQIDTSSDTKPMKVVKSVRGGLLVQEEDRRHSDSSQLQCVTQQPLAKEMIDDVLFGEKVVKHVKSNAIVVVKDGMTLGVGCGQLNRVGAAEIALKQAGEKAKGAVLASDAFFPMSDTVELAVQYGINTIVQPGGSIKDQASIDVCNQHQITMVFTGERHFKH